VEWSGV
jgi:hypothetical protein